MSHVDDGTLHGFLDGELTPVEAEQIESHLAGCAGCRARLDEERALIERAARLLGAAVPPGPDRTAPPLHQLRPPRPVWRRLRVPLAWAATIVLALGLGWYGGSRRMAAGNRSVPTAAGRLSRAADTEQAGPPAPAAVGALADRPAHEESDERQAAPSAPAASNAIVVSPAAPTFAARDAAAPLSTTWPVIVPKLARDLLGAPPVVIPGYSVRALRRNPGAVREIMVEQEIAGVVVSLFEQPINEGSQARRLDDQGLVVDGLAAKATANERLARFVGGLRIEISGPLAMDSLSKLLELIRP